MMIGGSTRMSDIDHFTVNDEIGFNDFSDDERGDCVAIYDAYTIHSPHYFSLIKLLKKSLVILLGPKYYRYNWSSDEIGGSDK